MGPIGVFDSGYGGLTILKSIKNAMPQYDFVYLGDNARTPYGTRSFDVVYNYTLQAVEYLFSIGCHLVILACNTASAKALRTIQQNDIPLIAPDKRVLGVIRPSVEEIGKLTKSNYVGILATKGTVSSLSYPLEIEKLYGDRGIVCEQHACPMWVSIVENNVINTLGADYFLKSDLNELMKKEPKIDTIILGCTHYPFLQDKIKNILPDRVKLVNQGDIVAKSLIDYLQRHPEMAIKCSKSSSTKYYTTESKSVFEAMASFFMKESVFAEKIELI